MASHTRTTLHHPARMSYGEYPLFNKEQFYLSATFLGSASLHSFCIQLFFKAALLHFFPIYNLIFKYTETPAALVASSLASLTSLIIINSPLFHCCYFLNLSHYFGTELKHNVDFLEDTVYYRDIIVVAHKLSWGFEGRQG